MHLTIVKQSHSQKKITKSFKNNFIFVPNTNQTHNAMEKPLLKPNQTQVRSNDPENTYCSNWIFCNCLKKSRQNSNLPSAREPKVTFIKQSISSTDKKEIRGSSKIKVMSCSTKHAKKYQIPSQSLKKIKTISSYQQGFRGLSPNKINEILQTKYCTNTHPTPLISRQTSTKKKDQSQCQRKKITNEGYNSFLEKKLQLTISRQFKANKNLLNSKDAFEPLKMGQQANSYQLQIERSSKVQEQSVYNHLRMSSNEFKVIDPLADIKSLDTQYLKKKIAFSEVRTEKEAKTDREAIIEYLYEPIKILDWTKQNQMAITFSKKKNSQIYRSQAIRNIIVVNQHQLTQVSKYSEESIVMERGLTDVFNLHSHLHIASASKKSKQSVNSSVIKYDTSQNEDQQQWYQLPYRRDPS